jgi:hypothetical protein
VVVKGIKEPKLWNEIKESLLNFITPKKQDEIGSSSSGHELIISKEEDDMRWEHFWSTWFDQRQTLDTLDQLTPTNLAQI